MLNFYGKFGEMGNLSVIPIKKSICVHPDEQIQIIYKSIQEHNLSVLFPKRKRKICEICWLRNSQTTLLLKGRAVLFTVWPVTCFQVPS